jgi:hypothetical protein
LAPRCDDNVQNGYETGYDCGGGCTGCSAASSCNIGQDCKTGVCGNDNFDDTVHCRPATCKDRVANGDEPDVDCGQSCCQEYDDISLCPNLCHVGQRCLNARDCVTNKCYRLPRMGGDRFCAGTRPTDIDAALSSRMLVALRVEGQRRAFFNLTSFVQIVAFMLDVPTEAILVEAVTDVQRAPEWGPGAFADLVAVNAAAGWPTARRRQLLEADGDAGRHAVSLAGLNRLPDGGSSGSVSRALFPPMRFQGGLAAGPRGAQASSWPVYYITSTDSAVAVEVRLSLFSQPAEASLLEDRLTRLTGDLRVLPDGWVAERVLQRQMFTYSWYQGYCTTLVNASTVWDTNVTLVDCNTYANKTVWALKAAALAAAQAAAASATGVARRLLPHLAPLDARSLADEFLGAPGGASASGHCGGVAGRPHPSPPTARGRGLGSGAESAYTGLAFNSSLNVSGLPRVSFYDLMAAITPVYAWPPSVSFIGNLSYDPLYDTPSADMVPYELLVVVEPRGVPGRPIWDTLALPVQPVLRLVDRHDRPITSISAAVRVLASLDQSRFPAASSPVMLFGDISQQLLADGTFVFKRLYVNANVSAIELYFEATWLNAAGVYASLKATSRTFNVLNKPVVPIIIIPRVPLNAILVAFLTLSAIAAVFSTWFWLVRRRRRRVAALKIMDVTMVAGPQEAQQGVSLKAAGAVIAVGSHGQLLGGTLASRPAVAAQDEVRAGALAALGHNPLAFPLEEEDPLPLALGALPPGVRPLAVMHAPVEAAAQAQQQAGTGSGGGGPSVGARSRMGDVALALTSAGSAAAALPPSPVRVVSTVVVAVPHAQAALGKPAHILPLHIMSSSSPQQQGQGQQGQAGGAPMQPGRTRGPYLRTAADLALGRPALSADASTVLQPGGTESQPRLLLADDPTARSPTAGSEPGPSADAAAAHTETAGTAAAGTRRRAAVLGHVAGILRRRQTEASAASSGGRSSLATIGTTTTQLAREGDPDGHVTLALRRLDARLAGLDDEDAGGDGDNGDAGNSRGWAGGVSAGGSAALGGSAVSAGTGYGHERSYASGTSGRGGRE